MSEQREQSDTNSEQDVFVTVTGHSQKQGETVLHTLGGGKESDLVQAKDGSLVPFTAFFSEDRMDSLATQQ